MPRHLPPTRTWVTTLLGASYDPEKVCEYTGLTLHQFPLGDDCMGYWRSDGHLLACRSMNPEEKAWLRANPIAYQSEKAEFDAWQKTFHP